MQHSFDSKFDSRKAQLNRSVLVRTPAQPINRSIMWSDIGCGVASDDFMD
jgi:hypothetical protein